MNFSDFNPSRCGFAADEVALFDPSRCGFAADEAALFDPSRCGFAADEAALFDPSRCGFAADEAALFDPSRCGFAAGCEAGLCPAVSLVFENGLRPRFGLWPKTLGRSPNQGHSPK